MATNTLMCLTNIFYCPILIIVLPLLIYYILSQLFIFLCYGNCDKPQIYYYEVNIKLKKKNHENFGDMNMPELPDSIVSKSSVQWAKFGFDYTLTYYSFYESKISKD